MTKKTLQDWYSDSDISYSEKESLNKMGINDCNYYYLQDLKQILNCEKWAKESSEIRNKFSGGIKKITFFTPNFNDSKPDASNYSAAIVTDGNDNNWVIVYRPSYVGDIKNDVFIQKVENNALINEIESQLNGNYPILALNRSPIIFQSSIIGKPFVRVWDLPSDAKYNPDKYILPFGVVKRGIHFCIYLGNKWIAHLPGGGEPTQFDTWDKFCNPNGNSSSNSGSASVSSGSLLFPVSSLAGSSLSGSSSSSSGSSSNLEITAYHPLMPFKRKEEIIRHVAKVVSCRYGSSSYHALSNNCEHLANNCVFGIHASRQVEETGVVVLPTILDMSSRDMDSQRDYLDGLTSDYHNERERILKHIKEAEDSHSYARSKSEIENEKFQERIEVCPKDWCRIQ